MGGVGSQPRRAFRAWRLLLISVALQISVDVAAVNFETREPHGSTADDADWIAFRGRAPIDDAVLTAADPFQNPVRTADAW